MSVETDTLPPAGIVAAPFAQTEVQLRPRRSGAIWIVVGVFVLLLVISGIIGGIVLSSRFLNDKYRTLEPFSISNYLTSYKGLAGSKFSATLRVENALGWNSDTGRLMLFSTSDDPRPFAAVVPPAVSQGVYFTKGQVYTAELEVKEGGLIYVDSCQKD